jgi:serine/threonine-protein kinase
VEDRYADDAELIADLEDVLAIETARAGSATGEVTAVLRTLPSQAQRRVPFQLRHRVVTGLLGLLVLAAVAAGIVWLLPRAHHGTGTLATPPPKPTLTQVRLCQACAQGFNPLGSPSYETPHATNAIDNDLSTVWDTQQYYDHRLDKAGTGLYLDASPGTPAAALEITDATPGFSVTIYARNDTPPLKAPPGNGWTLVSAPTTIGAKTSIQLTSGKSPYKYFLVWITTIGGHEQLSIAEVTLYRYK